METIKIIKIGGNIVNNPEVLQAFLKDFSTITGPKILVHGGGNIATKLAKELDIPVQMINGRRVTDLQTLDIISMVYPGKINKSIVAQLQSFNCNALGFSGADGNTLVSKKRPVEPIDYGFVGDVTQVNTEVLKALLNVGVTPVFCAITHDGNGQLLNTNADTIASEIAKGFANDYVSELYYCFEKKGVLKDVNDDSSVITSITPSIYETLKADKVIFEGMLPKLDNCFYALKHNVAKVCIGLPEMLTNNKAIYTTLHH